MSATRESLAKTRRRRVHAAARIVVCGGGVAAVEALLAIRDLFAVHPHVDLVAPNPRFVYQPMSVAEPFGQAQTRLFRLEEIASDLGADLHVGVLERVDAQRRRVFLGGGETIDFDAAIVAVGAHRVNWLAAAVPFGGAEDARAFTALLRRIESAAISRLAFASPDGKAWTLPLYELALLTASWIAERRITGVELTVITPEEEPLHLFGSAASEMLRGQLLDRGIRIRAGAPVERFVDGRVELASGETLAVEELVALPRLQGPRIAGLPCEGDGFIPVDEHCRVAGAEHVYAAGDGTASAIKQGGLATQQADVAVEAIAAQFADAGPASSFQPALRAMLLTGVAPMYLRAPLAQAAAGDGAPLAQAGAGASEVAANALWWPPTKIAGRYLGPYLARVNRLGGPPRLQERPAAVRDGEAARDAHREARELALTFAGADAGAGDYASALDWLEVVERIEGMLPPGFLAKREEWAAALSRRAR